MSDASDLAVTVLPQHLSGAGRIATSADLRHRHLAEVLWYLRANGPTGRVATAGGCHIAPSTMTDLVHELKARKLILELPAVRGGVGRPKQPIAIDGSPWCVAGVHLTPKEAVSVGVTLGGKRVWHQRDELMSNPSDPATAVRQLGSILARQVRALPRGKRLVGVGVALPDAVAAGRARQGGSASLPWNTTEVREWLIGALMHAGLPTVKVTIAGESKLEGLHAVRSVLRLRPDQTALYVGGGSGLDGAVIMDGQISPGRQGRAGEFAHLLTTAGSGAARCRCGRLGCLDTVAGLPALLRRSGQAPEATDWSADNPGPAVAWLRTEADAGNPAVLDALDDAGSALNQVLDAACLLLDPAVVIIGGHLGALSSYLPRFNGGRPMGGVDELDPPAVEYLAPVDLGPVLGAALAAQDECLTEPLTWTEPVQPSTAALTRRYRVRAHVPPAGLSV